MRRMVMTVALGALLLAAAQCASADVNDWAAGFTPGPVYGPYGNGYDYYQEWVVVADPAEWPANTWLVGVRFQPDGGSAVPVGPSTQPSGWGAAYNPEDGWIQWDALGRPAHGSSGPPPPITGGLGLAELGYPPTLSWTVYYNFAEGHGPGTQNYQLDFATWHPNGKSHWEIQRSSLDSEGWPPHDGYVPEPGSLLLLATGVGAMATAFRRKRQA